MTDAIHKMILGSMIMLVGCKDAATKPAQRPETQREYVASHHCKVNGYVNYNSPPTNIYTSDSGLITTPGGGGFTAYLCPDGTEVYINYGQ